MSDKQLPNEVFMCFNTDGELFNYGWDSDLVVTHKYVLATPTPPITDEGRFEEAKELMKGAFVPDCDEDGMEHQRLWMQVIDELGIYPAAVNDVPRSDYHTGWSEAVMKATTIMCGKLRQARAALTQQPQAVNDDKALALIEVMRESILALQASFEVLLDSARQGCDLTDEGVARLVNASIDTSNEALAAYKELTEASPPTKDTTDGN